MAFSIINWNPIIRNFCYSPAFKHCLINKKNFGTSLKWETTLETGLQKIITRQKPGMIVVHKSWCGACRGLKPKFESSKDITHLSEGFVMISLADDNHPKDGKYMPDGDYVPRIMFLNPQGVLLFDIINEDAESIASSMKRVLNKFPD
ncbi:thioredoxin domain-containing protein 12 precursor, putative [Pediculus humanus corporis]|uniref:Thioredoxin domain-containing protein 12, putative n=1 Tax=Pediculus humanus subsp. corporis TaxID=121224 RepID=E0W0R8_PEDHC|nr:thioredoxin domain-containing protein 12 precursor, putative [Pediculus humanus corporis]EEB19224.1 thioredoxin domain-containing protein 12 precursor, putative [Pediculus humanus corporis]